MQDWDGMKDGEENQNYKRHCNCETSWICGSEIDCVPLSVVDLITGPICFF